jgi:hypothetical protein
VWGAVPVRQKSSSKRAMKQSAQVSLILYGPACHSSDLHIASPVRLKLSSRLVIKLNVQVRSVVLRSVLTSMWHSVEVSSDLSVTYCSAEVSSDLSVAYCSVEVSSDLSVAQCLGQNCMESKP